MSSYGAGNGSRTHLSTLGRSHSTDELYPHAGAIIAEAAGNFNTFLSKNSRTGSIFYGRMRPFLFARRYDVMLLPGRILGIAPGCGGRTDRRKRRPPRINGQLCRPAPPKPPEAGRRYRRRRRRLPEAPAGESWSSPQGPRFPRTVCGTARRPHRTGVGRFYLPGGGRR